MKNLRPVLEDNGQGRQSLLALVEPSLAQHGNVGGLQHHGPRQLLLSDFLSASALQYAHRLTSEFAQGRTSGKEKALPQHCRSPHTRAHGAKVTTHAFVVALALCAPACACRVRAHAC